MAATPFRQAAPAERALSLYIACVSSDRVVLKHVLSRRNEKSKEKMHENAALGSKSRNWSW